MKERIEVWIKREKKDEWRDERTNEIEMFEWAHGVIDEHMGGSGRANGGMNGSVRCRGGRWSRLTIS